MARQLELEEEAAFLRRKLDAYESRRLEVCVYMCACVFVCV
jgi:hypothetical protein